MIQIRNKPSESPDVLKSEKVKEILRKVSRKVATKTEITDRDFENIWTDDEVRLKLWEYQNGKCCYCERKRDQKGEPDIEHFRPKTKVGNEKPGYWWLAYDWDNLFFVCKRCNKKKLTKFPLREGRRARSPKSKVREHPYLPHPVNENPEDIINFIYKDTKIPLGIAIGCDGGRRGNVVVDDILKLNDDELPEERGRCALPLKALAVKMNYIEHKMEEGIDPKYINKARDDIEKATSAKNPFAGFRRSFFRGYGCDEYIARD